MQVRVDKDRTTTRGRGHDRRRGTQQRERLTPEARVKAALDADRLETAMRHAAEAISRNSAIDGALLRRCVEDAARRGFAPENSVRFQRDLHTICGKVSFADPQQQRAIAVRLLANDFGAAAQIIDSSLNKRRSL